MEVLRLIRYMKVTLHKLNIITNNARQQYNVYETYTCILRNSYVKVLMNQGMDEITRLYIHHPQSKIFKTETEHCCVAEFYNYYSYLQFAKTSGGRTDGGVALGHQGHRGKWGPKI